MPISVYINNNVWDFLFERQLDLAEELPRDDFCICITREAEFEIPAIPPQKAELKAFIDATIEKCQIRTDSIFGFYNPEHPPNEQRAGGFNVGRFISQAEADFMRQQNTPLKERKMMKTRLVRDEADISLAARSLHSVVLTLDRKPGPINDAYKQGGKVIFLNEFDQSGVSLRDYILSALNQS